MAKDLQAEGESRRYDGLPPCSCGHDRSDHWSSGDPVPMCTRCGCGRYVPKHADYRCAHDWYTYFAGGAPDHDMCLLCCKTRQATTDADAKSLGCRIDTVLDQYTCESCGVAHGSVVTLAELDSWKVKHAQDCTCEYGCRCVFVSVEAGT